MPENRRRPFRRSAASRAQPRDLYLLGALIFFNIAVYLAQEIFRLPLLHRGGLSLPALRQGALWTPLTHLFIHDGWGHLSFNMILLALTGRRVLAEGGWLHFAAVYLMSGLLGAAVSLLVEPKTLLVGASGAVCGVIGAWAALNPEESVTAPIQRFFPWRLRAKFVFLGCFLMALALEAARFSLLRSDWNLPLIDLVAHGAHAAGLLTGWLYARRFIAGADREFPWRQEEFFPQGLRRRRREEEFPRNPFESTLPEPPEPSPPGRLPSRRQDTASWSGVVPAAPPPPPGRTDEEFLREDVDPVLEKLYASGMQSLTPEERRILDKAAALIARKSRG